MLKCIRTILLPLVLLVSVAFGRITPAQAACTLASDKGQSAGTITVPATGQYTLWLRMWAPNAASDSVFAQVDDQCPFNMGDAQAGDGFRWVNFKDGAPNQSIQLTLTAGTHNITLAGREAGAGVDRVMVVGDASCAPVGTGDNCLAASTSQTPSAESPQTSATPIKEPQRVAVAWPFAPNWWVVGASAAVTLAMVGFIIWK